MGGPQSRGLGEGLIFPHRKNWSCYETDTCASGLQCSFGTISVIEKGHEIWHLECKEPV